MREFLLHLASERGLAENSILAYRRDLEHLEDHLRARGLTLTTAAGDDIRAYLRALRAAGSASKTALRRLAAIRLFLKFLETLGHDSANVLRHLDSPKPENALPHVLSRAQVDRLVASPDPKSLLFWRDVAILELLYACGLRASELCDLQLKDLNLDVGAARVLGKGSKERIVPVGQAARQAVAQYLHECRPRLDKTGHAPTLFLSRTGKPLERVALWMLVQRYGKKCGLARAYPHILRHCFASHLLSGGADLRVVQELLGHANVNTTQIYTHVDTARLLAVHKRFHPRK